MTEFNVEFKDDFSGPARDAAESARAVMQAASGSARSLAAMGRSATAAARSAQVAAGGMRGMAASMRGSSSAAATWNANVARSVPQANNLARGVGGLSGAMNAKAAAANNAGGAMGGLGGQMGGMSGKANLAGIAVTVLKVALAALAATAAFVGYRIGQAVMFLGRAQVAFRNLAHGAGAGNKTLKDTMQLAADLGLPVKATTKSMQKLLAMQFDKGTATELIKMGGALKSLGNTQEDVDGVFTALSQIKAVGKLQGDELNQLAERGVSIDLVYQNLAKRLGKTKEEVMKLKEAGKITADDAIAAIMQAVKDKGGVKNFDEMAKQMGKTLPGKVDLLTSAWELFEIKIAEVAQGPLLKALGPILDDLLGMLKGAGGSDFMKGVGGAFEFIGEAVAAAWPMVKAFFGGLADGLGLGGAAASIFGALGKAILALAKTKGFVTALRLIGTVLGGIVSIVGILLTAFLALATALVGGVTSAFQLVADVAGWLWAAFAGIPAAVSNAAGQLIGAFVDLGSQMSNGIVQGIVSGAPDVAAALVGAVLPGVDAARNALQIKSPSKVFEHIGQMVTAGFTKGVDPAAATDAMGFAATPAATPGAFTPGGGGGTNNSITIAVDAGAAVAAAERSKDPLEYAAAVKTMLRTSLIDTLELELATIGAG